jgi:hypothetical protein
MAMTAMTTMATSTTMAIAMAAIRVRRHPAAAQGSFLEFARVALVACSMAPVLLSAFRSQLATPTGSCRRFDC